MTPFTRPDVPRYRRQAYDDDIAFMFVSDAMLEPIGRIRSRDRRSPRAAKHSRLEVFPLPPVFVSHPPARRHSTFLDEPHDAPICNPVLYEPRKPSSVEKPANVQIKHPVSSIASHVQPLDLHSALLMDTGFAGRQNTTCLRSSSYPSACAFGPRFFQTSPHDSAFAFHYHFTSITL